MYSTPDFTTCHLYPCTAHLTSQHVIYIQCFRDGKVLTLHGNYSSFCR